MLRLGLGLLEPASLAAFSAYHSLGLASPFRLQSKRRAKQRILLFFPFSLATNEVYTLPRRRTVENRKRAAKAK